MAFIKKENLPENVIYILDRIKSSDNTAYIVGGCVRDLCYGTVPDDWDITTSAKPEKIIEIFEHTVPTGLQHGTVTVIVDKIPYEITTYRIDGEYRDNRRPEEVVFTDKIEEDLSRRDFTINSMAYNPEHGIVDPFNGLEDLKKGIVKCVGNPDERFGEDALRIIRAVRFASTLGFSIEKNTEKSIIRNSFLVSNLAKERLKAEFDKIVKRNPDGIMGLINYGCIEYFSKELENVTYEITEGMKKYTSVNDRLVYMFLESGISSEVAAEILKNLRYSNDDIYEVVSGAELHERAVKLFGSDFNDNIKREYNEKNYRIFIKKALRDYKYDIVKKFIEFNINLKYIFDDIELKKEPYCLKQLSLNGKDLAMLGFKGKEIGQGLDFLLEKVIENPFLNTEKELKELLKQI